MGIPCLGRECSPRSGRRADSCPISMSLSRDVDVKASCYTSSQHSECPSAARGGLPPLRDASRRRCPPSVREGGSAPRRGRHSIFSFPPKCICAVAAWWFDNPHQKVVPRSQISRSTSHFSWSAAAPRARARPPAKHVSRRCPLWERRASPSTSSDDVSASIMAVFRTCFRRQRACRMTSLVIASFRWYD